MNENQTPVSDTNPSEPTRRFKKRRVLLVCAACLIGLKLLSIYLETPTVTSGEGLRPVMRFEGEFPHQDAEVRFYTQFLSGNPLCSPRSLIGLLLGRAFVSSEIRMGPAYAVAPVEVKRGEGNQFSGQVYIDHFNSGWCGWRWGEELLFDVRPHAATEVLPLAEWAMPGDYTARTRLRAGEKVLVTCRYTKTSIGCAERITPKDQGLPEAPAFITFNMHPMDEGKAK